MSAQFTPGPWKRSRKRSPPLYIISEGDNGQTVARVIEFTMEHKAEQVANANLIASAPELFDALAQMHSVIDAAGVHNLSNGVQLGPTVWAVKAHDAMDAAELALAKARGELA